MEILIVPKKKSNDVEVIVRKHAPDCKGKDETAKDNDGECRCPKSLYIKGAPRDRNRPSARTTSWTEAESQAEDIRQKIREASDPKLKRLAELERKKQATDVLIEDAIKIFLADKKKSKDHRPSSSRSIKATLDSFEAFLKSAGVSQLDQIAATHLTNWRLSWPDYQISTMNKMQAHIKTFANFCVDIQHWIEPGENPFSGLTPLKGQNRIAAVPFTQEQYRAVLDATYRLDDSLKSYNRVACAGVGARLRALIQLMRWSALSIMDATTLERSRIGEDGVLKVRRVKLDENTRVWVIIPLPPDVVAELRALPSPDADGKYFFWTGVSKKESCAGDYSRDFVRLWKLVKWPTPVEYQGKPISPHSHMFRHSFAFHYLHVRDADGRRLNDLRDLSRLLGHSTIQTTEKYYLNEVFMPDESKRLNQTVIDHWMLAGAPGFEKKPGMPESEPEHRLRVPVRRRASR